MVTYNKVYKLKILLSYMVLDDTLIKNDSICSYLPESILTGNEIRDYRKRNKITQRELSDILEIPLTTLRRLEYRDETSIYYSCIKTRDYVVRLYKTILGVDPLDIDHLIHVQEKVKEKIALIDSARRDGASTAKEISYKSSIPLRIVYLYKKKGYIDFEPVKRGPKDGCIKLPTNTWHNRDLIYKMVEQGRSQAEIASKIGTSRENIRQYLVRHDMHDLWKKNNEKKKRIKSGFS